MVWGFVVSTTAKPFHFNMNPRAYIKEVLASAKNPALMLSFGKDSVLLLKYAQDAGFNGTIYHWGNELSDFAEDFILSNDLTVFSYAPVDRYLLPSGDGLALIDEYALNNHRVPTVRDVVKGDKCDHGVLKQTTSAFRFPHSVTLWGYRAVDDVPVIGMTLAKEIEVGGTKFIAPLYEMSDAQVYAELDELGLSYEEDNSVEFCDHCLDVINNSNWDREESLTSFRQRFQLSH